MTLCVCVCVVFSSDGERTCVLYRRWWWILDIFHIMFYISHRRCSGGSFLLLFLVFFMSISIWACSSLSLSVIFLAYIMHPFCSFRPLRSHPPHSSGNIGCWKVLCLLLLLNWALRLATTVTTSIQSVVIVAFQSTVVDRVHQLRVSGHIYIWETTVSVVPNYLLTCIVYRVSPVCVHRTIVVALLLRKRMCIFVVDCG